MLSSLEPIDLVRLVLWVCSEPINNIDDKSDVKKLFRYTTKIQKLIFLAQHASRKNLDNLKDQGLYSDREYFQFVADKYGPYSKDLQIVLHKLKKNGEIEVEKMSGSRFYKIKGPLLSELQKIDGNTLKHPQLTDMLTEISHYSKMTLSDLLGLIYRNPEYNEYLVNSEIAHKY